MEILVVFAVLAVLAGILVPVFTHIREKGRQSACVSNLHQLGLAIGLYTQDNDQGHPVSIRLSPSSGLLSVHSTGWAGRIYPYLRSEPAFACPDDPTAVSGGSVPVSYALNSDYALAPSDSALTAPANTVLLFEISGDPVQLTTPDEGASSPATQQTSAAGNGVDGALLNLTSTARGIDGASYATGLMDNAGDTSLLPFDQYAASDGRHSQAANFLAADGHAKSAQASRVSSGANAVSESDPQSPTGCRYGAGGEAGNFECAEGAALGLHALTFSVR